MFTATRVTCLKVLPEEWLLTYLPLKRLLCSIDNTLLIIQIQILSSVLRLNQLEQGMQCKIQDSCLLLSHPSPLFL